MNTILYVDIGNTRIKIWLCQQDQILFHEAMAHERVFAANIQALLQALPQRPDAIYASCVLGDVAEQAFSALCRQQWGLNPQYARSSAYHAVVQSAYQGQPHTLGVDRWLGLIAARDYQNTVCVVSCGSAITLDVLNANGQHEGGYILPGFSMMANALLNGTDKVRFDDLSWESTQLGQNTAQAVAHGALATVLALVKQIQWRAPSQPMLLLLTGGDAMRLLPFLSGEVRHIPDLLLKGMQRYFADAGIKAANKE